ncbi:MAG TPA: LPS export ABC transporter periplasmic protein LptC [Candidatus Binataceae bacterium]|jgi:LPS export ABC transporter protein LptC|nr:LPS export ABC transporter periplasmic protein LptC [Candidatus Binataceae bacterium]
MSPRQIARILAGGGAVALVTIVIVTVWVVRHRKDVKALTNAAGLLPGALLHARNFHWTQMKGDQSEWILQAKDASYAADKTSMVLKGADLSMIGKDGKRVELVAPLATLQMDGNHIGRADLSGGLIVHYGDFVLTTERAIFAPDNDELQAPGAVRIQGQGLTVTGVGLRGHPKEEEFQLLNEVSTRIIPKAQHANAKIS